MTLTGKYNIATVYTNHIDEMVKDQIIQFLNESFIEGEHIAIMPDTHVGKGAVIGTTMTTANRKICPNLVGVDIGCGIMVTKISTTYLTEKDFQKLDKILRLISPMALMFTKSLNNMMN